MPVGGQFVLLWFPYIIVYFPKILKGSFCLSKCSFATQISEALAALLLNVELGKDVHMYTIEAQFSYRETAVHMHGEGGGQGRVEGFTNLAVK